MTKTTIRKIFLGWVIISVIAGLLISSSTVAKQSNNQTTTFINVGEGDLALLQDGNGFNP
jgi:flagellar biosynthesis protein FliQ